MSESMHEPEFRQEFDRVMTELDGALRSNDQTGIQVARREFHEMRSRFHTWLVNAEVDGNPDGTPFTPTPEITEITTRDRALHEELAQRDREEVDAHNTVVREKMKERSRGEQRSVPRKINIRAFNHSVASEAANAIGRLQDMFDTRREEKRTQAELLETLRPIIECAVALGDNAALMDDSVLQEKMGFMFTRWKSVMTEMGDELRSLGADRTESNRENWVAMCKRIASSYFSEADRTLVRDMSRQERREE